MPRRPHPGDRDLPVSSDRSVAPDEAARDAVSPADVPARRKMSGGLMALSSAAVLSIYLAGFLRTRPAAEKYSEDADHRRPAPTVAALTTVPSPPPTAARAGAPVDAGPAAATAPKSSAVEASAPTPSAAVGTPVPAPAAAKKPAAPVAGTPLATPATTTATSAPATTTATSSTNTTSTAGAAAPAESAAGPTAPSQPLYRDGTYTGWGSCRHGDIQASVTIESGRITAAAISQCWTRYSCSWVAHLPPQVVSRQSAEVDYVSGATQSGNAFYWAVVDALAKAK